MSYSEKLVEAGFIEPDFLEPENRDGWKVSSKTKKVWSVQLDLLAKLNSICVENNLKWFPIWGTLLGAVRHKGFIPWDDDVDVVMPRDDYEKLINDYKNKIEYPYFLQTTLNDEQCFYVWASLRNSETTGNRQTCLRKRQNNGVGIDILPLDGCENKTLVYALSRFPVRFVGALANTYVNEFNVGKLASILRSVLRFTGFDYVSAYKWIEKQNKKRKIDAYDKVAVRSHNDCMYEGKNLYKDMWDKADFSSVIQMPFENLKIPVPVGYDHLLKQIYGDYMTPPPLDKRQGKHDVVFVPDVPYKKYCGENYGVKYD